MSRRYVVRDAALLLVAPHNDFLSAGGAYWDLVRQVPESAALVANVKKLLAAWREAGLPVVHVPHRQWLEEDLDAWAYPTPGQLDTNRRSALAFGSWGAEWHPELVPMPGDVTAKEHWGHNGFVATDLDLSLRQRLVRRLVVIGMGANTFVESTARYGVELGYHVALVRDATTALSIAAMSAAFEVNAPTYAHAILNTDQLLQALTKS